MKKLWWLSALLVVALAAGCSDDTDDKTPATTTDSGTAADAVAGTDAGPGTDAGTAADAGSEACLASPYTPTTAEVTYYGKGCSEPADLQYLKGLSDDATKGDAFRKVILDCLLAGGCSGKGDTKTPEGVKKVEECTKTCIQDKAAKGIGESCANCAAINGTCGFVNCLGACAANPGSDGCKKCLACKCDPVFVACQQLPKT